MNMQEAVAARHSVRAYENKPIDEASVAALSKCIEECNREGDLHIQLVSNEPKAFDCFMAHYGKFSGVTNYVALIGKKSKNLDEKNRLLRRKNRFACANARIKYLLGCHDL